MPKDHDHESWAANRAKKIAAWKLKLAARKAEKRHAPNDKDSKNKSKSSGQKLGLAKSFRAALTTNIQLGDAEAAQFVETVMD